MKDRFKQEYLSGIRGVGLGRDKKRKLVGTVTPQKNPSFHFSPLFCGVLFDLLLPSSLFPNFYSPSLFNNRACHLTRHKG